MTRKCIGCANVESETLYCSFCEEGNKPSPDCEGVERFAAEILRRYVAGEDNAYEAYLKGSTQLEGETDIDFVYRCACLDYEAKDCVYADVRAGR